MKKRILALTVTVTLLASCLIACSGGKKDSAGQSEKMYLTTYETICDQGVIRQVTKNEDHITLTTFFDPESGNCVPICSKVNCSHNTKECDAVMGECVILSGGHLYYVTSDPDGEQLGDMVIMRADTDGTDRKILHRIKNAQTCFWPVCEDGYLVYPYISSYDEEGQRKKKQECGIYLLNLGTEKLYHVEMPENFDAKTVVAMMYHGILYFDYNYSTVDWTDYSYEEIGGIGQEEINQAYRREIWKYDPKSKERSLLFEGEEAAHIGFCDGKLLRQGDTADQMLMEDVETGKKQTVKLPFGEEPFQAFYLEKSIVFYSSAQKRLVLYDLKSGKTRELGDALEGSENLMLRVMTEHRVYIERFSGDGTMSGLYYMPREAFLEGKSEWKKVAEYEN